jgi:DNA helicase-2/ATP-dependent DNA helicase PcrA
MEIKDDLNASQLKAVTTIKGPVLVIAGAGTGKTRVVTYRTAHLLDEGISPYNILLLTFTVKAAAEMRVRAEQLTGVSCSKLTAENFHKFALVMLRRYGTEVGVPKSFSVLDAESSANEMRRVMLGADLDVKARSGRKYPTPKQIGTLLSFSRNNAKDLFDLYDEDYGHYSHEGFDVVRRVIRRYQKVKKRYGYLDFDDLLFKLRLLLKTKVGRNISSRFHYVMVDEYQDTNLIQARITSLLTQVHRNVMGVGDPAQCLYSWRGAYIDNLYQFENRFPGTQVIQLEDNYRSYQPILNAANKVMAAAADAPYTLNLRAHRGTSDTKPKIVVFDDRAAQYTSAADIIGTRVRAGAKPSDFAVLARSMASVRRAEMELKVRKIPYVIFGGTRFSEMRHIKDVFAILRMGVNAKDSISARRALSLVPGIGTKTSEKLAKAIYGDKSRGALLKPGKLARSGTAAPLATLHNVISSFTGKTDPFTAIKTVFDDFYAEAIKTQFREDDIIGRLGEIRQVMDISKRYKSLRRFINELVVTGSVDKNSTSTNENPAVLSTIHSAKGLEFDTVFILDMVEGFLPNAAAFNDAESMEEERRCAYVAMTRAKNTLYMYAPMTFDMGTGHQRRMSRFISNLERLKLVEVDSRVSHIRPRPPQNNWKRFRKNFM